MRTTRRSKLAAVLAILTLVACTGGKPLQEARASTDFDALQEATVTLFPGHCAGVVVADGLHALTAAHCLEGEAGQHIPVVLKDGQVLGGEVVLLDQEKDVAVIRFEEAAPVRPLPVAPSLPEPGTGLLFAGRNDRATSPHEVELERLGRCPSLPGVPSALFTTLRGEKGDSGAPVVDRQLRVVGLVHGGAACSIATPTADFAPVLDILVAEQARPQDGRGLGGSGP
jgi:S1-C subfamily serine protease